LRYTKNGSGWLQAFAQGGVYIGGLTILPVKGSEVGDVVCPTLREWNNALDDPTIF